MSEKARIQVGALCWRIRKGEPQILLVTSRDTRRWIIPKGWPMPALVHSNAAKQEAFEEAGVMGRVKRKPLGVYSYDKVLADGSSWPCKVLVFSLAVESKSKTWKESAQRDRKWLAPSKAALRVQEPGLRNLIKLLGRELSQLAITEGRKAAARKGG